MKNSNKNRETEIMSRKLKQTRKVEPIVDKQYLSWYRVLDSIRHK